MVDVGWGRIRRVVAVVDCRSVVEVAATGTSGIGSSCDRPTSPSPPALASALSPYLILPWLPSPLE